MTRCEACEAWPVKPISAVTVVALVLFGELVGVWMAYFIVSMPASVALPGILLVVALGGVSAGLAWCMVRALRCLCDWVDEDPFR